MVKHYSGRPVIRICYKRGNCYRLIDKRLHFERMLIHDIGFEYFIFRVLTYRIDPLTWKRVALPLSVSRTIYAIHSTIAIDLEMAM